MAPVADHIWLIDYIWRQYQVRSTTMWLAKYRAARFAAVLDMQLIPCCAAFAVRLMSVLSAQENLAPFLALAGLVSDGLTTSMFRDYWSSLPWGKATFHTAAPSALTDISELLRLLCATARGRAHVSWFVRINAPCNVCSRVTGRKQGPLPLVRLYFEGGQD